MSLERTMVETDNEIVDVLNKGNVLRSQKKNNQVKNGGIASTSSSSAAAADPYSQWVRERLKSVELDVERQELSIRGLRKDLEEEKKNLEMVKLERDEMKTQLLSLQQQLEVERNQHKEALNSLKADIQSNEHAHAIASSEWDIALRNTQQELNAERELKQKALAKERELMKELSTQANQIAALQRENLNLKEGLDGTMVERENEKRMHLKQLDELEQQVAQRGLQIQQLESQIGKAQSSMWELSAIASQQSLATELRENERALMKHVEALTQQLNNEQSVRSHLESTRTELQTEIATLKQQQQLSSALEAANQTYRQQILEKEELCKQHEGAIASLRQDLHREQYKLAEMSVYKGRHEECESLVKVMRDEAGNVRESMEIMSVAAMCSEKNRQRAETAEQAIASIKAENSSLILQIASMEKKMEGLHCEKAARAVSNKALMESEKQLAFKEGELAAMKQCMNKQEMELTRFRDREKALIQKEIEITAASTRLSRLDFLEKQVGVLQSRIDCINETKEQLERKLTRQQQQQQQQHLDGCTGNSDLHACTHAVEDVKRENVRLAAALEECRMILFEERARFGNDGQSYKDCSNEKLTQFKEELNICRQQLLDSQNAVAARDKDGENTATQMRLELTEITSAYERSKMELTIVQKSLDEMRLRHEACCQQKEMVMLSKEQLRCEVQSLKEREKALLSGHHETLDCLKEEHRSSSMKLQATINQLQLDREKEQKEHGSLMARLNECEKDRKVLEHELKATASQVDITKAALSDMKQRLGEMESGKFLDDKAQNEKLTKMGIALAQIRLAYTCTRQKKQHLAKELEHALLQLSAKEDLLARGKMEQEILNRELGGQLGRSQQQKEQLDAKEKKLQMLTSELSTLRGCTSMEEWMSSIICNFKKIQSDISNNMELYSRELEAKEQQQLRARSEEKSNLMEQHKLIQELSMANLKVQNYGSKIAALEASLDREMVLRAEAEEQVKIVNEKMTNALLREVGAVKALETLKCSMEAQQRRTENDLNERLSQALQRAFTAEANEKFATSMLKSQMENVAAERKMHENSRQDSAEIRENLLSKLEISQQQCNELREQVNGQLGTIRNLEAAIARNKNGSNNVADNEVATARTIERQDNVELQNRLESSQAEITMLQEEIKAIKVHTTEQIQASAIAAHQSAVSLEDAMHHVEFLQTSLDQSQLQLQQQKLAFMSSIDSLKQNLAELVAREEKHKKTQEELERQLGRLESELHCRDAEIQGGGVASANMTTTISDLKLQLRESQERFEEERKQLEEQQLSLTRENGILHAQLLKCEADQSISRELNAQLRQEHQVAVENLQARNETLAAELMTANARCSQENELRIKANSQVHHLSTNLETAKHVIASLEAPFGSRSTEQADLHCCKQAKAGLKIQLQELSNRLALEEEARIAYENRISELMAQLTRAERGKHMAEASRGKLALSVEELKKSHADMERELEHALGCAAVAKKIQLKDEEQIQSLLDELHAPDTESSEIVQLLAARCLEAESQKEQLARQLAAVNLDQFCSNS